MASQSLAYRGRFISVLLIVLGLWGGLVPFVGPYFGYAYTPDKAWAYTSGRLWLSIVPAAAVVMGGLLVLLWDAAAAIGAFLAALGGVWFVLGPVVAAYKLASRGITLDEVQNALSAQNVDLPTGLMDGSHEALTVVANGQLTTVPEFSNVVVAYRNGAPVRLHEVAQVIDSVQDTRELFPPGPAVNILLLGASTRNLICQNQLSATMPAADDGLNIGCKGTCSCGFQSPTTGATDNLVLGNTADNESRYGFAQATGNSGTVYANDEATGNGVANFAIDP